MSRKVQHPRSISRRDSLKVVLVPAGAALTSHWLLGCSDGAAPALQGGQLGAGQGATIPPASQTAAGTAATAVGAAGTSSPGTASSTGAQASPAAGTGAQQSAGSGGAAGSSSTAGAPATAANGGSGGAAGSAGTSAQAGAGGAAGAAGTQGAVGSGVAGPGVMWATGGTKSIMGNYPDPFTSGSTGAACKVYPTQTIGPCYANMPAMRSDISDGLGGLPMRLSFLVVKANGCTPVPNATIDIWHSGSQGIYSAYATGTVCNPGTNDVKSMMFCRGVQTSDESGRCDFSTVFPGWYKGRTIHIHFTVRLNGKESVTSQIYFEDALVDEILAQGDYKARGKRDTTNATDTQFKTGGATPDQILFTTAKRPDGALHAWKVLQIG
jgi:protocatechuate 3,4-dioxygenase beta subunit